MKKNNLFPIILIISFIILVPLLRCKLFFDTYLIKLLIVQYGVSILFIYLFCDVKRKNRQIEINPSVLLLLCLFVLVNIISWIMVDPPFKYSAVPTLITVFIYALLFFVISQYVKGEKETGIVIAFWTLTAIASCFMAVFQYYNEMRVIGFVGNENFLAAFIGMSIPVSLGFIIDIYKKVKTKYKDYRRLYLCIGIIVILLMFFALYLTHARAAWLGISASLLAFFIIGWVPKGKRIIITVILIVLLFSVLFLPHVARFIYVQFGGDVRPAIWEGSLYMIAQKPLLGWGRGTYFIFYPSFRLQDYWLTKCPTDLTIHAHNEPLQILAESGIIGFLIFIMLIFTILYLGIKEVDKSGSKKRYVLVGIMGSVIGLLAHNFFCNNLQMPSSAIFFWISLGIITASVKSKKIIMAAKNAVIYKILLAITLIMIIITGYIGIRVSISQYYFKKGLNYRAKDNWEPVINEYKKAFVYWPWDVEMHYRMAYAYTKLDLDNEAIRKYNDVVELAPLYGNVHRNLGILYSRNGNKKYAYKEFLTAYNINEYDVYSQYNVGELRKELWK